MTIVGRSNPEILCIISLGFIDSSTVFSSFAYSKYLLPAPERRTTREDCCLGMGILFRAGKVKAE